MMANLSKHMQLMFQMMMMRRKKRKTVMRMQRWTAMRMSKAKEMLLLTRYLISQLKNTSVSREHGLLNLCWCVSGHRGGRGGGEPAAGLGDAGSSKSHLQEVIETLL